MEIHKFQQPVQTTRLQMRRVDEPSFQSHAAETLVEVADRWSSAPRLAPALASGLVVTQNLGAAIAPLGLNSWVHLGVVVTAGISAAAVGGYLGPTLAKKAEQLGQKLAPKVGMDPHIGGIMLRSGFKAGTMAATYALAPGVGAWLAAGEGMGLMGHFLKVSDSERKERNQEQTKELQGLDFQPEAGQQLQFNHNGFTKTYLVTGTGL